MTYDDLDPVQQLFLKSILTDLQHQVVKDRLNGHPWQRIANAMNLDEATVRGHHRRAIRRLTNARKEAA